jgi:type VI secretion system secreted protein VgrG
MADKRHAEVVTSPLGKDDLLFHSMSATEQLGRPFEVQLELLSKDNDIALDRVLGQGIGIRVETGDGHKRHFHGVATQFQHVGSYRNYAQYTVTLSPWLWLLTLTANCRIFQEKKAPDIIKEVFRDHGFTDFEDKLSGSYPERTYCVQYRESDFNFVSRLMEQEGIYYYFKHEAAKHTLVLSDAYGAHSTVSGYEKVPYYPPDEHGRREQEHLSEVTVAQNVQPGKYKVNSFDFEKPKADLLGSRTETRSHDHSDFEIYDYPAEYVEQAEGDRYARVYLESYQAGYETVSAVGDACGLAAGCLFTLEHHPRESLNREYLVVESTHEVSAEGYETDAAAGGGNEDSIPASS